MKAIDLEHEICCCRDLVSALEEPELFFVDEDTQERFIIGGVFVDDENAINEIVIYGVRE